MNETEIPYTPIPQIIKARLSGKFNSCDGPNNKRPPDAKINENYVMYLLVSLLHNNPINGAEIA